MLLFEKLAKAKDMEQKWLQTLEKMPNGIILVDIETSKIKFINKATS